MHVSCFVVNTADAALMRCKMSPVFPNKLCCTNQIDIIRTEQFYDRSSGNKKGLTYLSLSHTHTHIIQLLEPMDECKKLKPREGGE